MEKEETEIEKSNEREINSWYPLQVWLCTLFIAPTILFLYDSFFGGRVFTPLFHDTFFAVLFYGLLFSIPEFLVSYVLFEGLVLFILTGWIVKTLFLAVVAGWLLFTFGGVNEMSLIYFISAVISSFLFNVRKKKKINS